MFSSIYTSNPFQSFPSSSSYPPLPFYVDPQNAFASDTILHDPLGGVPFMPTTQAPTPETATNLTVADYAAMLQRDTNGDGGGAHYGGVSNFLTKKPAAKKDRHSKIFTSQGLRDRRVRLSSEIARKFFDLQDMLEYDKPSNTLEWLFTKSENAIRELARSKHSCSGDDKCFCSSPELQGAIGVDSNDKLLASATATVTAGDAAAKERKLKWVEKEDVCVQAKKESREKARARARERTSSKMCSSIHRSVKDMEERFPATADPQILHQLMPPIQPQDEDCARWPNKLVHPHTDHLLVLGSEAPRDGFDAIEESIALKSNLKPSLMSFHHQNLETPKETSLNNNDYHSCPNSPTNWDTNEDISGRSSFCGIASMNLSTELQIFGKSWEKCTNQRRH